MERDAGAFQYASEDLRSDKTFVINALRMNGDAFQYVSDELRSDGYIKDAVAERRNAEREKESSHLVTNESEVSQCSTGTMNVEGTVAHGELDNEVNRKQQELEEKKKEDEEANRRKKLIERIKEKLAKLANLTRQITTLENQHQDHGEE